MLKMSEFTDWFDQFIATHDLDTNEMVTRVGTYLKDAPPYEQSMIRDVLTNIERLGGEVDDYLRFFNHLHTRIVKR